MDDWLPGYEHQPVNAGLNWTPGTAWKVGLHSTETGPAPRLIDVWRQNPGAGLPHFLGVTPDRIVQLLPLSVGAYTAQNPPGGVDTNRSHLIQIEVCAYAKDAATWCGAGAPWTKALGKWLADLDRALGGGVLDLTTELDFGGAWVGFAGDYDRYGGVLGHQHIPEQPDRHWDPGPIDIAALLAEARANLGIIDQEDDDMGYLQWSQEDKDALVNDVWAGVAGEKRAQAQPGSLFAVPGRTALDDLVSDADALRLAVNTVTANRAVVVDAVAGLDLGSVSAEQVADAVLAKLGAAATAAAQG